MVTEQPKLSSERIAYLSRGDEELQSLLAEVPEADHAELVEAHEAQKRAAELLKGHRKRARLRTTRPQPAAQERREGAQAYLLAKYEEIGTVDDTLWDLLQLRNRDPAAYRDVVGSDENYKLETIRKYWYAIPKRSARRRNSASWLATRARRDRRKSTGWAPSRTPATGRPCGHAKAAQAIGSPPGPLQGRGRESPRRKR